MTNRTATTVARIRPIVTRMVRTGTVARTGTSGIVSLTTQGDSHALITQTPASSARAAWVCGLGEGVGGDGVPLPHRLRFAHGGVHRRLLLGLGVDLGAEQDDVAG